MQFGRPWASRNETRLSVALSDFLCSFITKRKVGYNYIVKDGMSFGPHWPGVIVTLMLIGFGTALNYQVANEIKSDFYRIACYFFIHIMCASTVIFLLLTALTDPGIVTIDKMNEMINNTELLNKQPELLESCSHEDVDYSDIAAACNLPYCDECRIIQPPNWDIRHCYDCGVCIERLDHHCPWMGKCIGKKNMVWFILFNISWMVYTCELLLLVIYT